MELRTAVVVEDEADIRELVAIILREAGFVVHTFECGADGVEGIRRLQPDVVTLDLGLPDIDGVEVARQVRQFSDAYIVMLTARTEEFDTLIGLESGADDYVTKPFRPRVLRHRVEALMRRPRRRLNDPDAPGVAEAQEAFPAATGGPVLEHNGLRLEAGARSAEIAGMELDLTRSEFDLLFTLMEDGRKAHSKADLARILNGQASAPGEFGYESDEQIVQAHIGNLRKKLGDTALQPRWVETVRGFGYRLTQQLPSGPGEGPFESN